MTAETLRLPVTLCQVATELSEVPGRWLGREEWTVERHEQELLLRQLIDAHDRTVRVFVARYEFDASEADEVVGDVYEVAFAHLDVLAGREPEEVRNWLLRTARYLTANRGRRNATRRRAIERLQREPLALAVSPEEEFFGEVREQESTALLTKTLECLDDLTAEERQLLIMYANSSSGIEIAEAIGTRPGAARQRLWRARAAFRAAFDARSRVADEGEDAG